MTPGRWRPTALAHRPRFCSALSLSETALQSLRQGLHGPDTRGRRRPEVRCREGRRIALFFSGRQHASENLQDVLRERVEALRAPVQMCDALSRNLPGESQTIFARCLAHDQRQFVDVAGHLSVECATCCGNTGDGASNRPASVPDGLGDLPEPTGRHRRPVFHNRILTRS